MRKMGPVKTVGRGGDCGKPKSAVPRAATDSVRCPPFRFVCGTSGHSAPSFSQGRLGLSSYAVFGWGPWPQPGGESVVQTLECASVRAF